MTTKRIIAAQATLIASLALGLAGCGGGEEKAPEPTPETEEPRAPGNAPGRPTGDNATSSAAPASVGVAMAEATHRPA